MIKLTCANRRRNALQRCDEVRQEAGDVTIPFVRRQPGDQPSAPCDPFADERAFPRAGRSRDEGQVA
jgi:hypothetical protein